MKKSLIATVFALAPFVMLPSAGRAESPSASQTTVAAEKLVQKRLLAPLARNESKRSKFSRSKMPASDRRVRALDAEPVEDARGRRFVRFEIDELRGSLQQNWTSAVHSGCVYLDREEIYIKMKKDFRRSEMLLGKYRKPAKAPVCEPASTLSRR